MPTSTEFALNVPCKFNGVSIGKEVASVAVAVTRSEEFTIAKADEFLCGRRLQATIVTAKEDEDARQTNFLEGERHSIVGVFDAKSFRASKKKISFTLSFQIGEVSVNELANMADQSGRILIKAAEDIPAKPKKGAAPVGDSPAEDDDDVDSDVDHEEDDEESEAA